MQGHGAGPLNKKRLDMWQEGEEGFVSNIPEKVVCVSYVCTHRRVTREPLDPLNTERESGCRRLKIKTRLNG